MSFFANSTSVEVKDCTMNDINGNQIIQYYNGNGPLDLYRILSPVGDASYTRSGPVAKCHPGTRQDIIQEVEKWINDSDGCPILWLNGPAGSGKSAIAQTIAEHYAAQQQLAASFFFFRGAGQRSTIQHLIPTLAYQVSMFSSATKSFLQETMKNEPNLHHEQALYHQLVKLLVNPIQASTQEWSKIMIIIDALDACDDKKLMSEFIEALSIICNTPKSQLPFRIFLISRVEEHIQAQFYKSTMKSVVQCLSLQNFDATKDIQLYLKSRLSSFYESRFMMMQGIAVPWPSKDHLKKLSKNAAGSFIIASTLVKFIETEKGHPHDNLEKAIYMTHGLDHIYHQVITTALQENKTLPNRDLHILGSVLAVIGLAKEPLSITAISILLQSKAYHIAQMLLGLQAILLIPEKDNDKPLRLFATSLRDYLCSKQRSKELCIDMQQGHARLAITCLQLVVEYSRKDDDLTNQEVSIYACKYWLYHLNQSLKNAKDQDLLNDTTFILALTGFTQQAVIYWWRKSNTSSNMKILYELLRLKGIPIKIYNVFEDCYLLLKKSSSSNQATEVWTKIQQQRATVVLKKSPKFTQNEKAPFNVMQKNESHPTGNMEFQYSKCTGHKKALCIGINYTGQLKELRGCVNDAKHVREFLIKHQGYRAEDIVSLTDDSSHPRQLPTRRNIIDAIEWLVGSARVNDSFFFHYSGYGGQAPDGGGGEADCRDEVIYPMDFKKQGHIADDELHNIMVKPLPPGCRLIALFDSPHSGTVLGLPYIYSSSGRLKDSHISSGMRARNASPADVISWSVCKDGQRWAEMVVGGVAVGAMSYAFITALTKQPAQTYKELLQSIRLILHPQDSQEPQLGSSHHIDTDLLCVV